MTTKKEIISKKFQNFIIFLKENSNKTEEIERIEKLSVEELINGYIKNLNKFQDLKKSSIELIIFLDIIPVEQNINKIERYLSFFHEILNV